MAAYNDSMIQQKTGIVAAININGQKRYVIGIGICPLIYFYQCAEYDF